MTSFRRETQRPSWVTADMLDNLISYPQAVTALEQVLQSGHSVNSGGRGWLATPCGGLYFMPASSEHGTGIKINSVSRDNAASQVPVIQGVYLFFDGPHLTPTMMVGASELTSLRTPAVSALATKYLARTDSRILTIYGAGMQAEGHAVAISSIMTIEEIIIMKHKGASRQLVETLKAKGLQAREGGPQDLAITDILCTCTTSDTPLFDGTSLPSGIHINAIGAYSASTREIDSTTVAQGKLVIENTDALSEAGDILIPLSEGLITEQSIAATLAELVNGRTVRTSDKDMTIFKSVGASFEDLIIVQEIYRRLQHVKEAH